VPREIAKRNLAELVPEYDARTTTAGRATRGRRTRSNRGDGARTNTAAALERAAVRGILPDCFVPVPRRRRQLFPQAAIETSGLEDIRAQPWSRRLGLTHEAFCTERAESSGSEKERIGGPIDDAQGVP
jgi:hypothetical protein